MSNVKSINENAQYQRGYAAGKKRTDREIKAEIEVELKQAFRRNIYTQVITDLVCNPAAHNWGSEQQGKHKNYNSVEQFAKLADLVAKESMKYF